MINNHNNNSSSNSATATNNNSQENTMNVAVSIVFQSLLHVASNLEMVLEVLDDFNADEPERADEHEKELKELHRAIERLQKDITSIKEQPEMTETEKKPLIERIKERWDNIAELAKKCYYVTAMAPKIAAAAEWMATFVKNTV